MILPALEAHPTKPIFRKFGVRNMQIAKVLGISPNYTSAILCGNVTPSPGIEARLRRLADDILNSN